MYTGKYLSRLRQERRMTQIDLSNITGIRAERICEWERNKHQIKLSVFLVILKALHIKNISYILRDINE
ncbi:helix-turn-helix domain-containing protein [Maribacter sp. IgM3_T14_3]|uniref:helix-turn-helix domain-containing protein n=1 Tax=Maribacter sp. IgM3_T14_3 TaxID=3415140 RepID=UPI003C6F2B60|tara:strand:+ start:77932 stop:78138 length:207 start_codon:yes stop_codon:yes gene_type:complete